MKILNVNNKKHKIKYLKDSNIENIDDFTDEFTNFSWSDKKLKLVLHHFNEKNAGIKVNINSESRRLDVFSLYFSKKLISHIIQQTNIYAKYATKRSNLNAICQKKVGNIFYYLKNNEFLFITILITQKRTSFWKNIGRRTKYHQCLTHPRLWQEIDIFNRIEIFNNIHFNDINVRIIR